MRGTAVGVPVAFFVERAGLVGDEGLVGDFFQLDHGGGLGSGESDMGVRRCCDGGGSFVSWEM